MSAHTYERLHPVGGNALARELLAEARAEMRAPAVRPYVFANMVSTVDGAAAIDGSTRALGGPADTEMLLELRTIADAVLIGPSTVAAEGYARLVAAEERRERRVAAGLDSDPPAVLVSRSGEIPWDAGLFQSPEQSVLVYVPEWIEWPGTPAPVEIVVKPDLGRALADLRERGVERLLCEGGPSLMGALLGAQALDELFLTVAAQLRVEDGEPGIVAGGLGGPRGLDLRWVLRHADDLFLRYAVRAA